MTTAQIASPWMQVRNAEGTLEWVPALAGAYSVDFVDATGQPAANLPPNPNFFVLSVEADDAVAAALFADPTWQPCVLWMDGVRPADAVPDESEFDAMVSAFVNGQGVPLATVQAAVGTAVNGRTRRQIADGAIAYVASLPKG